MNYLEKIAVPAKSTFNIGLTSPRNADMLAYFGHPVSNGAYTANGKCTTVNSPQFKAKVKTRNIGPFSATGLIPALDSAEAVFARVKAELPSLYAILQTDGMLCARFTKIKQSGGGFKIGPNVSNHSWGTAIDVKLAGVPDAPGDNLVLRGLLVLSSYFNAAGWYWGAAFPTEDAMHFEVSKSLLANWRKAGKI